MTSLLFVSLIKMDPRQLCIMVFESSVWLWNVFLGLQAKRLEQDLLNDVLKEENQKSILKIVERLSDYPGALRQCLSPYKKSLWLVTVLFLFSQTRAALGDVGVLIGLMSIIIEPSRCSTVPGDYLWMADGGGSSVIVQKNPRKALILSQICLLSWWRVNQNTK